ncbi:beta-Ala-His dipeptidase isoform X1 [Pleurodeles waltl]|uniref:beta-Ala-His dipeptidase isoform X1 n=1 Tax=Pleurodeles waltl TaxID=8319 RepID=UPI003709557A
MSRQKKLPNFRMLLNILLIMLPLGSETAKLKPSGLLDRIFSHIDLHQDEFVQHLKKWLAIPSDSSDPQLRGEVTRMMKMAADEITSLGAMVQLVEMGLQELNSGESIPEPPVILAEIGRDPAKPTVCFYGHLDVQPARMEDGWNTDPYTMTEINGNLYARGATDNKGPVLAWLHAVETYTALKEDIPVNLKFLIEGMEEVGSKALEKLIKDRKEFFSNIDYIVISDNVWLSRKPALTYGTRGSSYFFIEVEGAKKDLHSGTFGGITHEAMGDLVALLGKLMDSSGRILIPGIYDNVAPLTEEEKKLYENIEFDLEEHKNNTGVAKFRQVTKEDVLLHLWRYPSLSIHGIEGAFYATGSKTVIPAKVIGKFSIRLVPHMRNDLVETQVVKYLTDEFQKLKSPNKLKVMMEIGAMPWVADINDPQYEAARRAVIKVFGESPDMIRDGSTIPLARMFQDVTKKSVMMLPIGGADDGEHSQNEKISRSNYIKGTKLFATFFLELSEVHRRMQDQKLQQKLAGQ